MTLTEIEGRFAICRLEPGERLPDWAQSGTFLSATRTADELSIVCREEPVPEDVRAERGFRALKVDGPLDFALVGALADLTAALAGAHISVFAISTFDTDYVLVREGDLARAQEALERAGHVVRRCTSA